jgi:hypothetical protein
VYRIAKRNCQDEFDYAKECEKLKVAMDALYGCPHDLFPFGTMYGLTGKGREIFLYRFRFEDPETQFACGRLSL